MPEGGCFCDNVRFSYEGDIQGKALCHCRDCQKITGSTYSTNIIIPGDKFKILKGTPKQHKKTADSGNEITSHFCGDCGSTLWRDGKTFGESKVVKVGSMDDPKALEDAKPAIELYVPERISWVKATDGQQLKGMPGSEQVA